MKFFNVKTAIAAVCVVAAGFSGMKAYNNANQSEADLLLAENVEALTAGEDGGGYNGSWCYMKCYTGKAEDYCIVDRPSGGQEVCNYYKDKNADIGPGDQSDYDDSYDVNPETDWGSNPANDYDYDYDSNDNSDLSSNSNDNNNNNNHNDNKKNQNGFFVK